MRTIFALCCAFALALAIGCATSQPTAPTAPTATVPPAPKVAPSRDDCPSGWTIKSNPHGAACTKMGQEPRPDCKPSRCLDTGYMLWDCPELTAIVPPSAAQPADEEHWLTARTTEPFQWTTMYLVNHDGSFQCECATNATRKTVCRDCKPKQPGDVADPELQAQLERTAGEYQCLLRMGPSRVRKVACTSPPGRQLSHVMPTGQPYAEYHYYRKGDQHFVCPLKPREACDRSTAGQDEACVVYAECLEVCRDSESRIIW